MEKIIKTALSGHRKVLSSLAKLSGEVEKTAALFIRTLKDKGKIIFFGNGGSAADAQHLAAELVGRFKKNRPPLHSLALGTNICTLTAISNDFCFEDIFIRQLQAQACPDDVVVALSTSGNSKNIIKALRETKKLGLKSVGFLGKGGGRLKSIVDIPLVISSDDTARIQEMHILIGHIICEIVEEHFACHPEKHHKL